MAVANDDEHNDFAANAANSKKDVPDHDIEAPRFERRSQPMAYGGATCATKSEIQAFCSSAAHIQGDLLAVERTLPPSMPESTCLAYFYTQFQW